ncbi:MAG: WbqC family protein [Bacteroidales bacterium]|nr:MAG: WbqC family protein [Bacteroidales bacterium]
MGIKTYEYGYDNAILSTAYLGPVQYFTKFILYSGILIEQHETYLKQSYRNRCYIYGTNGRMSMVIPVKKVNSNNTKTQDILIDYDTDWQRIHWNSIVSAYRSSPFFDFYEDDLRSFYSNKEKTLLDFNQKILLIILGFLEIDVEINLTDTFHKKYEHAMDLRQGINPKKRLAEKDNRFVPCKYNQVFIEKYGFLPNLSIIDLLFNEGPYAREILRRCVK